MTDRPENAGQPPPALQAPAPPTSPARVPVTFGRIVDLCVGVISEPVPTLRVIVRERPVGPAILVALFAGAVTSAASAATGMLTSGGAAGFAGALLFGGLVGLLVLVPSLALSAAAAHVVARMFGGAGSYAGLFSAFGFISVIGLLSVPLQLLLEVGGVVGELVTRGGFLALFIWALVAVVLATRENYVIGTGAAIGVLVISFIALIALTFVLILVVVLLVILALAVALGG